MKRRKRILENLPIAPPLEPRKPEPTLQEEWSEGYNFVKYRLGPRKCKRFTKRATIFLLNMLANVLIFLKKEEYNFDLQMDSLTVWTPTHHRDKQPAEARSMV